MASWGWTKTYGALALAVLLLLAAQQGRPEERGGTSQAGDERVVLAGGCFWGMEAVFEQLSGVTSVVPGYAGGNAATAHYLLVSTGETGHAESVEVAFDSAKISFRQLLDVFFNVAHDPTQLDRQGPDEGTQYRSAIFYTNAEQREVAEGYIRALDRSHRFGAPIVTQVVPLTGFYPAEAYHRHFVERHPDNAYVVENDLPKLAELRKTFPALLRPQPAARS